VQDWAAIAAILAVALAAALFVAWHYRQEFARAAAQRDTLTTDLAMERVERESASEEVAAARDRLALLSGMLDALPFPIWRRRKSDLSLVEVNRDYARAVDCEKEVALTEQRELAAGAVAQEGRALAARASATGMPQRESHHVVIGGARRFIEVTEAPLGSDEMIGYARDFSDLELLQGEFTRHTDAHAEVLENIGTAIAIYGADRRLSFFNRAFAALWQLEADWLGAGPGIDEVMERLRERRRLPEVADFRSFKSELLGKFTSLIAPQEELLHLPDERTLKLSIAPHPFGGLIFIYEDVTDRLALERSFNTLTEVQRETLDSLYQGIAVFGTDGRLKLWNPAFATTWRIGPEELEGEPHLGFIVEKMRPLVGSNEDWPTQRRRLISRLMTHEPVSHRFTRNDGSILMANAAPLPDGNTLWLYLDITDTTRVAHALKERNDALEAADRLKSEFIANVSYELRTPLNVISGFAELLANQYFGILNERQLEYAQGIIASARGLMGLINDIIDLATIEAGYFTLERAATDIHAVMSSLYALSHERARERGLKFRLDCPPDIGTFDVDGLRLKQALFNLLSNAFKFTPTGGTVTLAAHREGREIALSVADTGPGIAPQDRDRMFEKFVRGRVVTNEGGDASDEGGAGLGLALVKSIVELHGGRVELDSVPGLGAAVTCYLPE
jgi:signal transduction histidine kinase